MKEIVIYVGEDHYGYTHGKTYEIVEFSKGSRPHCILDDSMKLDFFYPEEDFINLEKYRNNKIDDILK